jgi:hypothetical protein
MSNIRRPGPAESSGHAPADQATASFLRSCGADVDELRLGELGLHGNGHAMMLEKNNAEIAALITDWIVKHASLCLLTLGGLLEQGHLCGRGRR